jgi:hypothetical protein
MNAAIFIIGSCMIFLSTIHPNNLPIILAKIAVAAMGGGDAGMGTTDGSMLEMDANKSRRDQWNSNRSHSKRR